MHAWRHSVGAVLALSSLAVVAACGAVAGRAAGDRPSTTLAKSLPVSTTTTTVGRSATPTLGRLTGDFSRGEGFGQVKPTTVFNGGDPTGLVTHVVWRSWGGATATGTGTSDYVGPNQNVAEGRQESVTVVAFNRGTCDGTLMYQAVEWFFPQHAMAFDPGHYEDICAGTYVPSP